MTLADELGVAAALAEMGRRVHQSPRQALEFSLIAARGARARGDRGVCADARSLAAEALLLLSRADGAARVLRRLEHEFELAGNPDAVCLTAIRRVQALVFADRLEEADDLGARISARLTPSADARSVRRLLLARASLAFRRERPREALSHYRQVRRLPPGAPKFEAKLDLNLSNSLAAAGRRRAAARRFAIARERSVAAGVPTLLPKIDQNEAAAEMRAGNLRAAVALFERALDAAERAQDVDLFPTLCLDRAELFLLLDMPYEARQEVLRLRRRGLRLTPIDAAHADYVEAFATLLFGSPARAADLFVDVVQEYRALGIPDRAAHCELLCARAMLAAGETEEAARRVRLARATLPSARDPRTVSAHLLAAEIACREGDVRRAWYSIGAARAAADTFLPPWTVIEIARTEAAVAAAADDREARREALERAADVLERQMGRLPLDEYLIPFLAARSWLYEALTAEHLADGRVVSAFETVERGRARALRELLDAPGRLRATLGVRRIERRARDLGAALYDLHDAATRPGGAPAELRSSREERVEAGLALAGRGRSKSPERVQWRAPGAQLPAGTTLLEYAWIEDRAHAFVVRRGAVAHVALDVDRNELRRVVARLELHLAASRQADASGRDVVPRLALERHLGRAAELLWQPVAHLLGHGRVVVVPADTLHLVPFHALPHGEGRVHDICTVTYAPSAAAYATPPRLPRAASGTCTVFAVPDERAPQIREEALAVESVWPGADIRVGEAADAAAFRAAAAASGILHVATHGVFRPGAPLFSAFRLADTWVNAYDVYDMHVAADLVVLSACETARGAASRDEDRLGLVRAFLVAGAGRVLAPQWPVSDGAARTYVGAFFTALRAGETAASAASIAARTTRRSHQHPADWGGWFLFDRAPAAE